MSGDVDTDELRALGDIVLMTEPGLAERRISLTAAADEIDRLRAALSASPAEPVERDERLPVVVVPEVRHAFKLGTEDEYPGSWWADCCGCNWSEGPYDSVAEAEVGWLDHVAMFPALAARPVPVPAAPTDEPPTSPPAAPWECHRCRSTRCAFVPSTLGRQPVQECVECGHVNGPACPTCEAPLPDHLLDCPDDEDDEEQEDDEDGWDTPAGGFDDPWPAPAAPEPDKGEKP